MNETLTHFFFQIFIYSVVGFIVWLTWDTDNIILILLSILSLLIVMYVGNKEYRWSIDKLKEIDKEEK